MCVAGKIARGGGRGVQEGLGIAKYQWLLINNYLSPNGNHFFYISDNKNIKRIICRRSQIKSGRNACLHHSKSVTKPKFEFQPHLSLKQEIFQNI